MVITLKNIIFKEIRSLFKSWDKRRFASREFVVISNNCWGAEFYKWLDKPYNTPFVGLFIFGPDYIKLLENFDQYLCKDLRFINQSKWSEKTILYPIGVLDDVEIHFMHYKSEEEAVKKWNRRLNRMKKIPRKSYYFKICDRDHTTNAEIMRFYNLPFEHKISFGTTPLKINSHIHIKENEHNTYVPDGIKLYRLCYKYVNILQWLCDGKIKRVPFYNILKFKVKAF
jgi:uncharacterized protein (DUF1919 family)